VGAVFVRSGIKAADILRRIINVKKTFLDQLTLLLAMLG
jgi:hypothetical protein